MTHPNKKDKNGKKAATKPAKIPGQPVLPRYARNDSLLTPAALSPQVKKGKI